jgi:hypothetical protein
MFVRFHQSRHRLRVNLVETRWVSGKVRHEHVASLRSIVTPPLCGIALSWRGLSQALPISNRDPRMLGRAMRG